MAKKKIEAGFIPMNTQEIRYYNGEDPENPEFDDHSERRFFKTEEEAINYLKAQADIILDEDDLDAIRAFRAPTNKVVSVFLTNALYYISVNEEINPFDVFEFDEEDWPYYGKAMVTCKGYPCLYICPKTLLLDKALLENK